MCDDCCDSIDQWRGAVLSTAASMLIAFLPPRTLIACMQIEALERQADEVVLLESRAELAESERDALLEVAFRPACSCVAVTLAHSVRRSAVNAQHQLAAVRPHNTRPQRIDCRDMRARQAGRAMTPRPSRELPAAERLLGADGLATLKAAIDRHKCVRSSRRCAQSYSAWSRPRNLSLQSRVIMYQRRH